MKNSTLFGFILMCMVYLIAVNSECVPSQGVTCPPTEPETTSSMPTTTMEETTTTSNSTGTNGATSTIVPVASFVACLITGGILTW